jgi:hypothetical protein
MTKEIDDGESSEIAGPWDTLQQTLLGQAVSVLVEIDTNTIRAKIKNVRRPRAIGVRKVNAPLIKRSGIVKPGCVVKSDLGPESSVADIGPVTNLSVANAHQIRQPVAGHVGDIDGFRAVRENKARTVLFPEGMRNAISLSEAFLGHRFEPSGEGLVFRKENVGMAIAGEVEEAKIGILPIDFGQRCERAQPVPGGVVSS